MNFGDDADLTFARRLVTSVLAAADGDSSRMLLSAPHEVMSGSAEGNLMLAVDSAGFADAEVRRIRAAGPHPGDALSGQELEQWLDDEDVCAART
ncbi:hypothetical protein [Nesterenkonia pannonica]|uniref:hypothetical protein n=1 Tax=Nesterenkonia pannonica TaxID=1548602 RepID=UPI002164DB36|nr:hypothetical protein [Nesterenkonia pannonica]